MSSHQPRRDGRLATQTLPVPTMTCAVTVAPMALPEPISASVSIDSVGPRAIVRLSVNRSPQLLTNLFCNVTSFDGLVRSVDSGNPVVLGMAGPTNYRIVVDDLAPGDYVFTACVAAKNGVDAVVSDIFTIRTFARN